MASTKNNIYSNCKMLSQDGAILAYVGQHRMDWYLKKDLAARIDDFTFQLKFNPRGAKCRQPKLYTEPRVNICVVCGTEHDLTRHHIVPYAYKKHFPATYKNRTSFDVVAVCIECHERYEKEADIFKKELMKTYQVSVGRSSRGRDYAAACTLLRSEGNLPEEVFQKLVKDLPADVVATDRASLEDFINRPEFMSTHQPSVDLVSQLPSISDFIIAWRKHFVQHAAPKFMPESWYEEIEFVYAS